MAALVTPAASLVSKLMVQGRQSAAVLEALFQDEKENAGVRELAAEILRCCDRALAALHGCDGDGAGAMVPGAGGRKRKSGPGGSAAQTTPKRRTRASGGETRPAKRVEKKCTSEDGFIWRKYGQKEILNSTHPRLYFRCTYRDDSGCPATRQVQQSEEDPSLYVITYFGDHTCCADVAAAAAASEVDNLGETHPFVINFGSAAASGGSPRWLSSSSDDGNGQSETSRSSSPNGRLTVGGDGEEELGAKMAKIEPASSELQPAAAELSSSGDGSCSSPAWDPLAACSDWDCFDVTSFDCFNEFFDFDDIAMYQ